MSFLGGVPAPPAARGSTRLARTLLCEGERARRTLQEAAMFRSQTQNDTNPFIVMCSVLAFHCIGCALLLVDSIHP
jgi:hypothetical protein